MLSGTKGLGGPCQSLWVSMGLPAADVPQTSQSRGHVCASDRYLVACAGGPLAAATAAFKVTADSQGVIALRWAATRDQAIVGGIELYPAERAPRSVPKAAGAAPAPAPARAAEPAALAPSPALEPFGLLAPAAGVPRLSKYEAKSARPSASAPEHQPSGLGVLDLQAAAPGPRPLPYRLKAAGEMLAVLCQHSEAPTCNRKYGSPLFMRSVCEVLACSTQQKNM